VTDSDAPTFLSLFSGIGGLDLGLERAGWECVGQVENDLYCTSVLAKHWPDVPRWGDIREVDPDDLPRADLIAGGFPCQSVSDAGLRLAQDDSRWLWPEMVRVIDAHRPEWVLVENVRGLRRRGLNLIRHDLHRMGYRARPYLVPACAVGAPHARPRVFTVAHAPGQGRRAGRVDRRGQMAAQSQQQDRPQPPGDAWWADEPDVARVAYGVPRGMDRRRALGNAVVPQVAELLGRRILEADVA
jgi:DNA (cytosine-5)-methyltransferase 1